MNTTLSERHLLDLTVLTDPEWTRRASSGQHLGGHLEGFLEAVDYVSTVNCTISQDGETFGLCDAAYALVNAGCVWGKQVDDLAKIAQQTMDALRDVELRKQGKKSGAHEETDSSSRKRQTHPLSIPVDDKKGPPGFLVRQPLQKLPAHKNLTDQLPTIQPEKFLIPNEPSTLPLMECERIQAYLDDRGNKGLDWAEFRSHTLRLNKEGYYPLECGFGAKGKTPMAKRRYTFSVMPSLPLLDLDDSDGRVDDFAATADGTQDGSLNGTLLPARSSSAFSSIVPLDPETIPLPPQARLHLISKNPVDSIFERIVPLQYLRTESGLDQIQPADEIIEPHETKFKRRCKKKVIPKDVEFNCIEVDFFEHFWDLEERIIKWSKVMERFKQRLQVVPVKGALKKGSARKGVKKSVKFVSMTPLEPLEEGEDLPEIIACGDDNRNGVSGTPGKAVQSGTADEYVDNVADYLDTDQPIGDEEGVELDLNTDLLLTASKRGAFNKLNYTVAHFDHHTTQYFEDLDEADADVSTIVEVDLHEWETRLMRFLSEHEKETAKFNLESCGKQLVECYREFYEDEESVMMGDVVGRKRSVGEVSRAFLSVLDLVNKNVVKLDVKDEETMSTASEEASRCGITVDKDR